MEKQIIFVDFHNSDKNGRVRLNTDGTYRDLNKYGIVLKTGLELYLDDMDGNSISCIVEFSPEENIWVGVVDLEKLKNP